VTVISFRFEKFTEIVHCYLIILGATELSVPYFFMILKMIKYLYYFIITVLSQERRIRSHSFIWINNCLRNNCFYEM